MMINWPKTAAACATSLWHRISFVHDQFGLELRMILIFQAALGLGQLEKTLTSLYCANVRWETDLVSPRTCQYELPFQV